MKKLILALTCLFVSFNSFGENRKSVSPKLKAELLKMFTTNEQLHKAFFDYEKQKSTIPSIATKLNQAIDSISDPEIKKLLKFSQTKLKEIKDYPNSAQRLAKRIIAASPALSLLTISNASEVTHGCKILRIDDFKN